MLDDVCYTDEVGVAVADPGGGADSLDPPFWGKFLLISKAFFF